MKPYGVSQKEHKYLGELLKNFLTKHSPHPQKQLCNAKRGPGVRQALNSSIWLMLVFLMVALYLTIHCF